MVEILQGDVKVPGVGKTKKAYIFIPVGLAGAYVLFRWYQASQEPEPEPGASGLYSTDDLSEYGLSTTGGATNVAGNTGSTETDATNPNKIDDNAEWTQKAVELLGNAGYDSAVVYAALGEFLGRRALDKNEATITRAALAAVGQPPVNGPFSVIEEATTGGTGTLAAPKNLKPWDKTTDSQIGFQWSPVTGAASYRVYRSDTGGEYGGSADTKYWAKGLRAGTTYKFQVAAVSSTGKVGPKSATYTAKTTTAKLGRPTTPKASAVKARSFRATTAAVKGATLYEWFVRGEPKGKTERPYRDFTGAAPSTTYKVQVRADTVEGSPGPLSGTLTVKTKAR